MEYKQLGKTGMKVSILSLGTWAIGGAGWGGQNEEDSLKAISAALDAGVNFIDSAQGYGNAEEVLGKALGNRSDVIIATKAMARGLSRDKYKDTIDFSRKRLQRDCIDIFYVHWPHPDTPVEEALECLNKAKEEGMIKAIGVSNFSVQQMQKSIELAEVAVVQPPLNIFWPFAEDELIPFCKEHNIGIAGYSPIARGILTGKFTKDWQFPEGDWRNRDVQFWPENFERLLNAVEDLKPIAEKYGKSLTQLAINWVAYHDGVTSAIVGVRNVGQLEHNLGALGWQISDEDREQIRKVAEPAVTPLRQYPNPFNVQAPTT